MIRVAPPEYVIIRKLEFYREGGSAKHVEDIRGIRRCMGESVDHAGLASRISRLGLATEWDHVREGGG